MVSSKAREARITSYKQSLPKDRYLEDLDLTHWKAALSTSHQVSALFLLVPRIEGLSFVPADKMQLEAPRFVINLVLMAKASLYSHSLVNPQQLELVELESALQL